MSNPEIHLHRPHAVKLFLESKGLYQVKPKDIVVSKKDLEALLQTYRDIAGDPDIGISDFVGHCQSYWGYKGWWKELVEKHL